MEVKLSSIIITFFLFLMLRLLAKYYKQKTYKLPPGPMKLPLIGNLHQMAALGSLPHRAFQHLAKQYGPIVHLKLGEISTIVISSPKLAKEILKTHDVIFANRPKLQTPDIMAYGSIDIAFSPYGDYWRQMRKICMLELLSNKRVQTFSYIREDETRNFIKSIQSLAGSSVNLTNRIFSLVSSTVSRSAFGDKTEDQDEFVILIRKAIESVGGLEPADLFPSMKSIIQVLTGSKSRTEKMHKKSDKIMEIIVRKHQEKQRRAKEEKNSGDDEKEDLVDVLLRIKESGSLEIPITTNNIKAVIFDAFAAGTDTTTSTIVWAISELIKNPSVMKKAQAEIREACKGKEIISESDIQELPYLKLVLKETLRLHPPTPLLLPRESIELINIDGYDIPKKTEVMINVWAMARDPNYWTDAEMFIPERFEGSSIDYKGNNFEYLPFGAGRRICPGLAFGIAGIMLPVALLIYHFNWELPNQMKPKDLDMTEHYGLAIGRKSDLCLIPTVYA
ncbi:cytochrome P450 71D8-like [Trifolium pratense]|uniref:cytochrome P450 71D8-like n=1 Tax=Trifolium pratense TaxID=57577 RepID=UPI001E694FE9|nr:cytochrome P450 71D8-like [Trifolium pratense]